MGSLCMEYGPGTAVCDSIKIIIIILILSYPPLVSWTLELPGYLLISYALSCLLKEPKSGSGNPELLRIYPHDP